MNIFKTIFKNSIFYKIFIFFINIYKNSYLKVFNAKFSNIYRNSHLCKSINNYFNKVPLYKYSGIKKVKEIIYLFIIKHSGFIYNFVSNNIKNSSICQFLKTSVDELKNSKFKSIVFFLSLFFFALALSRNFVTRGYGNIVELSLIGAIFAFMFCFSSAIINIFLNSNVYKLSLYLFKEVDDE